MSHVIARIMELIPPEWRGRVKTEKLLEFIEQALAGAKVIWDNLPRALASVQLEEYRAAAAAEKEATVPPEVVEVLQGNDLHLELNADGGIVAMPNAPVYAEGFDPTTSLEVAEKILRHECARHGLSCEIAYIPADDAGDAGEPGPQAAPAATPNKKRHTKGQPPRAGHKAGAGRLFLLFTIKHKSEYAIHKNDPGRVRI